MTTGDLLLAAIVRSPADDTPRLVFADWLDENGDSERAEFIRVQIALTIESDPERLFLLRRREKELLDQYADRFAGALAGKGLHWVFRRGFIHRFGHDGVYRAHRRIGFHYLRFFPDGMLFSIDSTQPPQSISHSLDPFDSEHDCGRYSLDPTENGPHIYFSSTGSAGTVDYTGTIEGQTIRVAVHGGVGEGPVHRTYTRVDT